MWDVLSKDYLQTLDKEKEVLQETINATGVWFNHCFHDNWKAEENMKYSIPKFIDHFQAADFKFEAIR